MLYTKHIWRAALLLITLGLVGILVRHFLIPESFGVQGFFRYGSLADYMAKPVRHGAPGSCAACHEEKATAAQAGKHAHLSCEVCHAPLSTHVANDAKTAVMAMNRSYHLCGYCHQKMPPRPAAMPQQDFRKHLEELQVIGAGEPIPEEACIACHDPHSPSLK